MTGDQERRAVAPPVPRAFRRYALVVALASLAPLTWIAATEEDGSLLPSQPRFWLLALFVLLGELLPIQVPRRYSYDHVAVSTAFAFAVLLAFGAGPGILVYAVTSVIADLVHRRHPWKVLFNAAQYAISLAAATLALMILGAGAPVASVPDDLLAILGAAVAFFVCNQMLAGTGAALILKAPLPGYLWDDLAFQAWTAGFLLALAPIVVVCADTALVLIPVSFVPMLAIYFGGRQAVLNGYRATHDMLTDLPNRVMLEARLREELVTAGRDGDAVSAMIIDLDNFKAVNDTLGHHHGDLLLTEVAPRLLSAVRLEDLLVRLGGDEFAVVVRGGPEAAAGVAERLHAALAEPFCVASALIDVSASIGIASWPADSQDGAELLQHADVALYAAKAAQSPWELYAAEHDGHTLDRLMLAGQLRAGIGRGELFLEYQPKFSLHDGRTLGVEALVRWRHPQLGVVGPDGFIPLAERTGVIKPLTLWVFDAALAQCRAWVDAGLSVRVSVNVSTASLLDRALPETIAGLLRRHGLGGESLQLEITETRVLNDAVRARRVIEELRSMQVAFAIDDFGTGFSSLTQLQRLPVDEIKIDKSFVLAMELDANDAAIVRSTIDLGRNLGLAVTAEGVETESVCGLLADLGCHYAQGYHLSPPVSAAACAEAVRAYAGRAAPAPEPLTVVGQR